MLRSAKHQVKHLASPPEEAPIIRGSVVVQVFVETIPSVREDKLRCPSLIAIHFKTGRTHQRNYFTEILERMEVILEERELWVIKTGS